MCYLLEEKPHYSRPIPLKCPKVSEQSERVYLTHGDWEVTTFFGVDEDGGCV